ncbi:MAG: penicillin acylase family protein [Candidatus Limnocylindria bacterium]
MRILRRAVAVGLIGVLVVLVAGLGALAYVTGRALPQVSGTIRIAGLQGEVTVHRDIDGIAHIAAGTPHDLFLAQGYVHAQERMWQMEVWRHIGAGRLAELFGPDQLDTDRFIRTLGWRRAAERDLASIGPDARAALDAYAAGVNAWLDANRDQLGLAYLVIGVEPEPWTVLDTLTWGKVQAWNLGGNMESEVFRMLADARLADPARTDQLFPPYRDGAPVITPGDAQADDRTGDASSDGAGPSTAVPALTAAEATAWRDVARLSGRALELAGLDLADGLASDGGIGSNGWVVGPGRSLTGGALLANDPHLGISMPSIWFVNGLHCTTVDAACPYDVAGVSFPGVPGVVLGHNARIAWGATNADPDVQDLVIETPDPADPGRYIGPDGTALPYVVRTERILVAGGEPVTLEVRETVHGPILNDVDERLVDAPPLALRWSGTHPAAAPDRTFEAILGLNTAHDFDDFRASLALYGAPSQNFVYADVDGRIGYQLPGYIPIRSDPRDRGLRPVRGDDGRGEWVGRIAYEDLPWQLDPDIGWIVSANNALVDDAYGPYLASEPDPGYRAERIIELIDGYGQDGLTVDELSIIQYDTAPLRARDVVGWLSGAAPTTADGRLLAARIADWDGVCDTVSTGCAAYMVWEYRVLRAIFDDELGPLAREYVGSPLSWVVLGRLVTEPDDPWWDDVTTPDAVETGADLIARAMDEAAAELRADLGDPSDWTWGRLHTATFRESTIGSSGIGPLEWYANPPTIAVDGVAGAINNTYYRFSRGYPDPTDPTFEPLDTTELFTVTNLPSYRLVMDLSDLDGARLIITTGQSGNPFDRHHGDMIERWATGETVPLAFTPEAIERAAVSTLRLTP